LWELETGHCARVLEGHTATVGSVAFTRDGAWAISGGWDKSVRCWEWVTGRCVRACDIPGSVFAVVPTPAGRHVVAACSDNVLRLLDLVSGGVVQSYLGHTGQTSSVQVTLDGGSILSGGWDDTLRVWEVGTGQCARVVQGFLEPPKSIFGTVDEYGVYLWNPTRQVALSADGHWAVAGRNHLVQLWELPSGRCHRTVEGHAAAVNAVDLCLDGRWLVSGGDDKSLRLWELNWDYEFPGWRDWDDGARPHLSNFLTRHTPPCGRLPPLGVPTEQQVREALARRGRPAWTEADFDALMRTLAWAGYGWLRPEGVRRELERMSADWDGPGPPIGTEASTPTGVCVSKPTSDNP